MTTPKNTNTARPAAVKLPGTTPRKTAKTVARKTSAANNSSTSKRAAPRTAPDSSFDGVVIKKYPNRRLYDTSRSTNITLVEIKPRAMAHKKFKVANLPLVPEVPLPEEIFQVPPYRIIGLIIDPYKLNTIRSERMKALGFSGTANYTDIARIEDELSYAKEIMRQLHCQVLDVSNKAIEETASRIMAIVQRNKELYGDKY